MNTSFQVVKDSLWGEHPLREGLPLAFDWGPFQLWLQPTHNELWLASQPDGEGEDAPEPPPAEKWKRYILKHRCVRIRLSPRFPDRPVVVQPENVFILTPRATARIYVRCPLWVAIEAVTESISVEVAEIPLVTLSGTWFGGMTEGDLCYSISSGARRAMEPDVQRPFLAICPIEIVNRSEEDFQVETICLRVSGLSIYRSENQLWADEAAIHYLGPNLASEIRFAGRPPGEAANAQKIAGPRIPVRQGFALPSFASLKDLSGLGLWSRGGDS
jgi:hypothetical protein